MYLDPLALILERNFDFWNFAESIHTEEQAITAAKRWLLIPSGPPRCPACNQSMKAERKTNYKLGFRWRCRMQGCNKIKSPLQGTLFQKCKVSILSTLRLILVFFKRFKVSQAAEETRVTKKIVLKIFYYMRQVCEVAEAHDREMIDGENVDETRNSRQRRLKRRHMGEYRYRKNILKQLPSDAARFRRLLRDIHRVYPGFGRQGIKIRNCRCCPTCPRR